MPQRVVDVRYANGGDLINYVKRQRSPATLTALACAALFMALFMMFFSGSPASAQISQPLNSQDQYEGQIVRVNGLEELAELGISGPEDFDYCDAEGCYILGPTDKQFFSCDPNWQCEYAIWPSSALSAEDFDYLGVLSPAGSYSDGEEYGESGLAYACGSGEVCLIVASYDCDPSGECEYVAAQPGPPGQGAGGGDVVPGAGRDANRAYDAFRRALENSPSATRTALASESAATSGAPPVSGGSASTGSQESGQPGSGAGSPQGNSGEQGSRSDPENNAAGDSSGGGPERGGAGAGDSDEQASGSGSGAENGAAGGNDGGDQEQGSAGAGEAGSGSSGSSGSSGGSSFLSSAGPQSIALGAGALALLAGGVVLAIRLLRS